MTPTRDQEAQIGLPSVLVRVDPATMGAIGRVPTLQDRGMNTNKASQHPAPHTVLFIRRSKQQQQTEQMRQIINDRCYRYHMTGCTNVLSQEHQSPLATFSPPSKVPRSTKTSITLIPITSSQCLKVFSSLLHYFHPQISYLLQIFPSEVAASETSKNPMWSPL